MRAREFISKPIFWAHTHTHSEIYIFERTSHMCVCALRQVSRALSTFGPSSARYHQSCERKLTNLCARESLCGFILRNVNTRSYGRQSLLEFMRRRRRRRRNVSRIQIGAQQTKVGAARGNLLVCARVSMSRASANLQSGAHSAASRLSHTHTHNKIIVLVSFRRFVCLSKSFVVVASVAGRLSRRSSC